MNSWSIDINCDVGEGIGNEELFFPYISSCNIACGGHTGTEHTIAQSIELALKNGVKIGAHPSYPDLDNFGRHSLSIASEKLINSIKEQLSLFNAVLISKKAKLHHIKPHGALYNDIVVNRDLALVFLKAIEAYKNQCVLYVPHGSIILSEALKQGWNTRLEAFGDRTYTEELQLVSRKLPNAVLLKPTEVLLQVKNIVINNKVKTSTYVEVEIKADTICIHGDTPNALQILMYLSSELPKLNIQID